MIVYPLGQTAPPLQLPFYPSAPSTPPGPIVVTWQPGNWPPRNRVDVTGFTTASTITVSRVDQTGATTPVRGAEGVPLVGGAKLAIYDYEAPYNVPVYYIAVPNTGASVASPWVELLVGVPWLVHPGVPSLSQPISVVSVGQRSMASRASVYQVIGRSTPIAVTTGPRQAATFDLTIRCDGVAVEQSMQALLADSTPLVLNVLYPDAAGQDRRLYGWVSIGDAVAALPTTSWFGFDWSTWTLPCTMVDRPVGVLQAQRTYADLKAAYPTYSALKAAYPTYADLVTG